MFIPHAIPQAIPHAIPQAIRIAHASVKSAKDAITLPDLQNWTAPPLSLAKQPKAATLWEEEYAPSQLNLIQEGGGGDHFLSLLVGLRTESLDPRKVA